ncbi:MAG: VTT domain-containing protein [Prolixibacteraceae bacterium]|jgi:membrane-associated protein|nr:VTT domain-containing protein [Prolixibacteraceae bacterium]
MMNEIFEILFHTNEAIFAIVSENVWEAYLVLFLIIFLETGLIVFPFLPGDGLLFSAGVIAASSEMSIFLLVPILILAAIFGNHFNYRIGKQIGDKIEKSQNKLVQKYLVKSIIQTRKFYEKHGKKSIIIGRFFPVIRTYIPFFAGTVKFDFQMFKSYTIIGSVIWVPFFTLSGYFLGELPWIKNNFEIIFLGLIIVTLIPFFYAAIKTFLFQKKA